MGGQICENLNSKAAQLQLQINSQLKILLKGLYSHILTGLYSQTL